jgi:hypothetical protein
MLQSARNPFGLRPIVWSCLLAMVGGVGCSVFQSKPPAQPAAPDAVERAQIDAASPTSAIAAPVKPGKYSLRVSQFVFYSDVPLEANDPLFRELENLPDEIQKELKLPPSTSLVQVFLFENQKRYEAFIKARDSELPVRPAFFFAEKRGSGLPEELSVFTWLSKRLRTDLRHELTHALLHGVLKSVPLWLDEGLAGFFEQAPELDGVNALHLEELRQPSFRPNLARLEKMDRVAQMQRPEYQEAWAWVHFMLRGHPKAREALLDHLQAMRTNPNPGPLLARLEAQFPEPNTMLLDYLNRVELPGIPRPRVAAYPPAR